MNDVLLTVERLKALIFTINVVAWMDSRWLSLFHTFWPIRSLSRLFFSLSFSARLIQWNVIWKIKKNWKKVVCILFVWSSELSIYFRTYHGPQRNRLNKFHVFVNNNLITKINARYSTYHLLVNIAFNILLPLKQIYM